MGVIEVERRIEAPPAVVWEILAVRFGDLTSWAGMGPARSRLETDGPVGVGTTRLVRVGRLGTLRETIVRFEPERTLAYEVHGLPSLLRDVTSTWTLLPDGDGTVVRLHNTSSAGWGPIGAAILWALRGAVATPLHQLASALKRASEARASG